jgi:hypothetical protein
VGDIMAYKLTYADSSGIQVKIFPRLDLAQAYQRSSVRGPWIITAELDAANISPVQVTRIPEGRKTGIQRACFNDVAIDLDE